MVKYSQSSVDLVVVAGVARWRLLLAVCGVCGWAMTRCMYPENQYTNTKRFDNADNKTIE